MFVMSEIRAIRVEVVRIPGRSWLIHIADIGRWSEVQRFETVPAVAHDLVAAELGPVSVALELVVSPDRCDRCAEPIYLANPHTADDCGDRWLPVSGGPLCSAETTLRRIG